MTLFIFENIHNVMIAEDTLKKDNINCGLVPIPKEMSPECGMALEVDCEIKDSVIDILEKEGIQPLKIYENNKDKL